jgi:hypothetical protein
MTPVAIAFGRPRNTRSTHESPSLRY